MMARALILRRQSYGESDLILKALLDDHRVISFFAPSAKRSKRRFPHQFDPSGVYECEWKDTDEEGRLFRLQRADLVDWRPELCASLEAWTRWMSVLEWASVGENSSVDFEALLTVREGLCRHSAAVEYFDFLRAQLQSHGIFPDFQFCQRCHKPVQGLQPHFVLAVSGLCHASCHAGIPLADETWAYLSEGRVAASQNSREQAVLSSHLVRQLDQIFLPLLEAQLDRPLKASSVLEQIHSAEAPKVLPVQEQRVPSLSHVST
jgi:recombinational DNA repair protein (RecF pathway)